MNLTCFQWRLHLLIRIAPPPLIVVIIIIIALTNPIMIVILIVMSLIISPGIHFVVDLLNIVHLLLDVGHCDDCIEETQVLYHHSDIDHYCDELHSQPCALTLC